MSRRWGASSPPGAGCLPGRVLWLFGLARREVHVTFCLRKQRSGSFQWEMEEEDGGRGRLPSWKHGGEAQAAQGRGAATQGHPPFPALGNPAANPSAEAVPGGCVGTVCRHNVPLLPAASPAPGVPAWREALSGSLGHQKAVMGVGLRNVPRCPPAGTPRAWRPREAAEPHPQGPWAGVPASTTRCHWDLVPQKALAALRDPCPALLPAQRRPAHSSGRRSWASCPKPAPDPRRPGEHPCGSVPARC